MLKNVLWAIFGLLLVAPVAAGIGWLKYTQFNAMGEAAKKMVQPPEVVTTVDVLSTMWQPRVPSVGTAVAVQGTDVSTEAEGVVRTINFDAGSSVTAGDVLLQLDIGIEQAQLREAEAAAELAKVSYTRAKELVESRNISQAEFDQAAGTLKQALAKVDNFRAIIAKKSVIAPFSGQLGIRQISIGQFLQKGAKVVSLQSLDPIYVEFSLPQQRLGELSEGLKVEVETDSFPGQHFEGKLTALNSAVDPATRNIRLQATLANPKGQLRPGMFVTVNLVLDNQEQVLFIPQTAVQHAPYGDSVFVVEKAKEPAKDTTSSLTLRQQIVRLGSRQGDYVIVTSGLKKGDTIVSTGGFKLRPNIAVEVDNTLAPKFSFDPNPKNT